MIFKQSNLSKRNCIDLIYRKNAFMQTIFKLRENYNKRRDRRKMAVLVIQALYQE